MYTVGPGDGTYDTVDWVSSRAANLSASAMRARTRRRSEAIRSWADIAMKVKEEVVNRNEHGSVQTTSGWTYRLRTVQSVINKFNRRNSKGLDFRLTRKAKYIKDKIMNVPR